MRCRPTSLQSAIKRSSTEGLDLILGTNGFDLILARGSADGVNGQGGNDLVLGGLGDDSPGGSPSGHDPSFHLEGRQGNDIVMGEAGKGSLTDVYGPFTNSPPDRDLLFGGPDNDFLNGLDGDISTASTAEPVRTTCT
jgi:hypothetical protein